MSLIDDPYEDLSKATQALKTILEADDAVVAQLPPVDRLMVRQIRQEIDGRRERHEQ